MTMSRRRSDGHSGSFFARLSFDNQFKAALFVLGVVGHLVANIADRIDAEIGRIDRNQVSIAQRLSKIEAVLFTY